MTFELISLHTGVTYEGLVVLAQVAWKLATLWWPIILLVGAYALYEKRLGI